MDPEKLMRHVVKSFEETDLEPLIEALHDDVVWKSASKQENVFRFGGDYYSKLGVLDALSHILMDYTIHHMRPREILASGNVVWGLFDVELDYDHKGMDPIGKSEQSEAIDLSPCEGMDGFACNDGEGCDDGKAAHITSLARFTLRRRPTRCSTRESCSIE